MRELTVEAGGSRHAPGDVLVVLVCLLFLAPVVHPLLRPVLGVPSHLLWFVHVLPVALLTFWYGRRAAMLAVTVSPILVGFGERTWGSGYWNPADMETTLALVVAVLFTDILIAGFALFARNVADGYRLLFDHVRMGVLRLGGDGRILAANPAALRVLGMDAAAAVHGLPLSLLIPDPPWESLDALAEQGGWSGQLEIHSGAGPSRTIHAFVVAIRAPGDDGCQLLLADRSLEVLQEREIERRSKLAALGEALAGVAHELNNPLTAIMGHAQLGLLEVPAGGTVHEFFDIINQQANRMKDLVGELLGFSRQEGGEEWVALDPLLHRVVRVQCMSLGRKVHVVESGGCGGRVRASAAKIEQIVLNLLSNAAYAVERAGGGRIEVSCRLSDRWVEIEVADDGPGIPAEILDRVFQPFTTTKPEGEGTGLGLAISRRLARTWGGDLTARNLEPHGASFVLTIPRDRWMDEERQDGSDAVVTSVGAPRA